MDLFLILIQFFISSISFSFFFNDSILINSFSILLFMFFIKEFIVSFNNMNSLLIHEIKY
ncbi:hypothetical protein U3516DRAFT_916371 [Neocallimastix sp. 'constans']